jgi:hypothetical protein
MVFEIPRVTLWDVTQCYLVDKSVYQSQWHRIQKIKQCLD